MEVRIRIRQLDEFPGEYMAIETHDGDKNWKVAIAAKIMKKEYSVEFVNINMIYELQRLISMGYKLVP